MVDEVDIAKGDVAYTYPRSAVCRDSNGLIHFVYALTVGGVLCTYHKSSSDGGLTWSAQHTINAGATHAYRPLIVVDSSDVLYCVYYKFDGAANYDTIVRTSGDAGVNWGAETVLWDGSAIGANSIPYSGAVDSSDNVHILSSRAVAGFNKIFHRYYDPSVPGWVAEVQVPAQGARTETEPKVSIDSNDTMHLIKRADCAINRYNPCYNSWTVGGGWTASVRLVIRNTWNTADHDIITTKNAGEYFYSFEDGANQTTVYNNAGKANFVRTPGKSRLYSCLSTDQNGDVYVFMKNTTDSDFEVAKLDYAGNTWGSEQKLGDYGGAVIQSPGSALSHYHPGGGTQGVPKSGFGFAGDDNDTGVPNERYVWFGSLGSGGGRPYRPMCRPRRNVGVV